MMMFDGGVSVWSGMYGGDEVCRYERIVEVVGWVVC